MSNATVEQVIEAWRPGQQIPTPQFGNWRDIQVFAQWLADNEHIAPDLRAKAAEQVAEAERQIAWWRDLGDAMRATDPDYAWDEE